MKLFGTYAGIVEANNDTEKIGRLKVRVPHVYGATTGTGGYIGTNDIPWALPAGMPAGGSPASGGFSQIPEPGDKVWVRFLDGEPEKPIWEWGMQSQDDAKGLTLHDYDKDTGKPIRAFWTRYGHGIEINAAEIIETTAGGYTVVLTDETSQGSDDGNIKVNTANGNFFQLDDVDDSATLNTNQDCNMNIGSGLVGQSDSFSWTTASQDFTFNSGKQFNVTTNDTISFSSAADFTVTATTDISMTATGADITLTTDSNINMSFATLLMGTSPTQPFVLGLELTSLLTSLLLYLDTHTHSNGDNGSPTGPPIIPTEAVVQPQVSTILSTTILGS